MTLAWLSGLLLLTGVAGFIGTVLIGRVVGRRLHMLIALLAMTLAATALSLALFGASLPITAILLAIWGFTFTSAPVAWWTWITRAAPDDPEAGGALMVAGVQISIMLGATLGGVVLDAVGPVREFCICAAALLGAAVLALAGKLEDV